jgi:hypothetical protein
MSKGIVILGTVIFAGVLGYLGFICSGLLLMICGVHPDSPSFSSAATAVVLAGCILPPAAFLALVALGRRRQGPR